MTALQDWLSNRPIDPRNLKALICEAFRGSSDQKPEPAPAEPAVLRRGIERC